MHGEYNIKYILMNVGGITHVKPLSKIYMLQLKYVNYIIFEDGSDFGFK